MKKIDYTITDALANSYLKRLSNYGETFLSGGFIRDTYLSKKPRDIDFIFFGDKDELIKHNRSIKFTKVSYNFNVLFFIDHKTKIDVKVYPKGTHPEEVLSSRDYTANFLLYTPGQILSPFNAFEDLQNRSIVDPFLVDARYERPLMIPRAFKLMSNHNFTFEKYTEDIFIKNFYQFYNSPEPKLQDIGFEILESEFCFTNTFPYLNSLGLVEFPNNIILPTNHKIIPCNNQFFFIYLAFLLNFIPIKSFEDFFSLFHLNTGVLKQARLFHERIINFKNDPISSYQKEDFNSFFYYFNSFESNSPYLDILKTKIKNEN